MCPFDFNRFGLNLLELGLSSIAGALQVGELLLDGQDVGLLSLFGDISSNLSCIEPTLEVDEKHDKDGDDGQIEKVRLAKSEVGLLAGGSG